MRTRKHGWTLLEMVIVLTIASIVGSVALPEYTKLIERARATEAVANLNYVRMAEEIYKQEHGEYTRDLDELGIDSPNDHPRRLFEYQVTKATKNSLTVRAKRNKEHGGNGKDSYTIDEWGAIEGP